MELEQVKEVIKMMPESFDSHEFIKKFIKEKPSLYGHMLIERDNVTTVHSEIANFLRNYADGLRIEKVPNGKMSDSIFGNEVPNACWRKI